jgi:prepilin-type N-terminal cleavage/methylation domain-containing protein
MTQKGFAILEMSVVMLIILVSIGVYTYTQKNNSSDQSITLSPTPSTNVDTTLSTFDYTYKVPENLSKEAAPQSQPRCWTHIDTAAPVTHQEITDLCVKTWKNSGEYLDGLQWIENSSEIAGFLQLANTNEYYGDITWSEKTSPVGSWYLSNQFVDLIGETPRYYAFLYGDTIVQIDSLDRDTLEEVVNSFNHVWQI